MRPEHHPPPLAQARHQLPRRHRAPLGHHADRRLCRLPGHYGRCLPEDVGHVFNPSLGGHRTSHDAQQRASFRVGAYTDDGRVYGTRHDFHPTTGWNSCRSSPWCECCVASTGRSASREARTSTPPTSPAACSPSPRRSGRSSTPTAPTSAARYAHRRSQDHPRARRAAARAPPETFTRRPGSAAARPSVTACPRAPRRRWPQVVRAGRQVRPALLNLVGRGHPAPALAAIWRSSSVSRSHHASPGSSRFAD
ncbi:hypothetical protein ABH920_001951 [Catenulispora sp. EB89]